MINGRLFYDYKVVKNLLLPIDGELLMDDP